jgi:hypothetical protein
MSSEAARQQMLRDQQAFGVARQNAGQAQALLNPLANMVPATQKAFAGAANIAQQQAMLRMGQEQRMLAPGGQLINAAQNAGMQMNPMAQGGANLLRGVGNQMTNPALLAQMQGLQGQFGGLGDQAQMGAGQMQLLSMLANQAQNSGQAANMGLGRLANQALGAGNQGAGQLDALGQQALQQGLALEQGQAGIRTPVQQTLQQVAAGQIPAAVRNLYSQQSGAERDMLERQFGAARQQAMEQSGAEGGAMSRTLGGLSGQRAMALVQQQADQGNAERGLSRELFGQAVQAGMAPSQLLGFMGLSGQLQGQGAQLQQAGIGQAGQLQQAGAGLQQAGIGLGGQLAGQREQLRQGGVGLAGQMAQQQGGMLQSAEALRQGQLTGQGQLYNQATQTGLQGLAAQQQSLLSALGARQSLGAQLGQGKDQLLMQSPALRQQMVNLGISGAQARGIPASIMQGGPQQNIAGLLGNAGQIGANAASFQGPPPGPSQMASAGSGALMGASAGMMLGPWGALAGGVAGGLLGAFA